MKKYLLFTTQDCQNCPMAKEHLKEKNIDFEVIDAMEDIINRTKYRIMSAPSLIVLEDNKVIGKHIGLSSIKSEI